MNGIVNVLKPAGMTSSDVVAVMRRMAGMKRVGHLGTLDPAAAGVLPVMLGRATRLFDILGMHDKEYLSEFVFGVETDTLDAQGEVTARIPWMGDEESVRQALQQWVGPIRQVPPMYSAIKRGGKKLYDLARQGVELDLPGRPVEIYALELVALRQYRAMVRIACSRGTYVRSLCRDVAHTLGTVGHTGILLRTRTGSYTLEKAYTLAELAALADAGKLHTAVQSMEEALAGLPAFHAPDACYRPLCHGAKLYLEHIPAPGLHTLYCRGEFFGLCHGETDAQGALLRIDQLLYGRGILDD